MNGERKKVPAFVGMRSLVGVGKDRPVSWGNYFWLHSGQRVANFWAENLEAANGRFLDDGLVEIVEWPSGIAVIDDARIPSDWYYDKMCWAGGTRPSLEIAREMFEVRGGDKHGELEQWSDPKSYWARRGGTYHSDGGVSFVTFSR